MHGNLIGHYGRELASQHQQELASAARHRTMVLSLKRARRDQRSARSAEGIRADSGCPMDRG